MAFVLLALHACIVPQRRDAVPPSAQPPPPPVAEEVRQVVRPAASPIPALLRKAQGEQNAGNLDAAAATIERGVRIDPYDPGLWHLLAAIRLKQGYASQAEAMAVKSNSLTSDRTLQRKNWSIIADAMHRQGNEVGAREAEQRARGSGAF
jgi:predicted Zn-dependent protease